MLVFTEVVPGGLLGGCVDLGGLLGRDGGVLLPLFDWLLLASIAMLSYWFGLGGVRSITLPKSP